MPANNNDNLLFVFFCFLCKLVVGFGVDPALRISVFDELSLGEGFDGVTQVQGFHSESRAFHFQGTVTHCWFDEMCPDEAVLANFL